MEVFRVRDRLIEDYRDFTGSFVDIHDKRIRDHVEDRMAGGYQWPDPWLSLNPSFASGGTVSELVGDNLLYANLASFALDYVARQKMAGAHLTFGYVTQLPVVAPQTYKESPAWAPGCTLASWIRPRVLELTYTAYDLAPFAADLSDQGRQPFRWDEERRFAMRCELDAAYFHLYGIERDDVDYIMDSFRAFQNNDRSRFERTKKLILDIYDAMAEAMRTGIPYQTILDPPPGQGPRHE